tara:strand:- start:438 stop:629 length:192 start_codon:yes stop_codon:yes gene_type:complete
VKDFKVGDLIKWHDTCADNIVVFASGIGIVTENHPHMNFYTIYRTKEKDYQDYNGYFLERVNA